MKTPPIAVELFAGCGGISTGLLDAGIRVVAGLDHNRSAIEAFKYNHDYRGVRGHVADLSKTTGEEIASLAGEQRINLLVGGPPCQPFSIVGKQKGLDDHRGNLVFDFLRLVGELRPEAVLFENVPNLEKIDDGAIVTRLCEEFAALDYAVSCAVLNAADYGVPQLRRRLFIVGVRGKQSISLPPPATHKASDELDLFCALPKHRTCRDAIDDLPDVTTPESWEIPNHEATMHSPGMLEAFAQLKPGKRDKKSFHDRLHPERPSYTLRAGTGNFSPLRPIHYKYDRVITVRESARIQSFSDDFIWPDFIPRLQQYRQVGNAVPPVLAAVIGRSIARVLDWHLTPDELEGDSASRPPAITTTPEFRFAERQRRTRGASLGRGISGAA